MAKAQERKISKSFLVLALRSLMVENSTHRTVDRNFPQRQRPIDFAAQGLRLARRLHFQLQNPR